MKDLSIIMPYVNEWPQVAFTIRSVAEELLGSKIDFEIIAVDNYPKDGLPTPPDRAHYHMDKKNQPCTSHIEAMAKKHKWLSYCYYGEKLSHWNAKNAGVQKSSGRVLLFLDAHVVPERGALECAYHFYDTNEEVIDGTLHLPLAYHILENTRLIYKLFADPSQGVWHYKFKTFTGDGFMPFKVPCMSTCGMFMSRELYDYVGGWPSELGIYGGGENFMNFTLAILGKQKWIYPGGTLYHHGDKRGYSWNYDDYHRNRMIALYCHGGEGEIHKYLESNQYKGSHRYTRLVAYEDVMKKLGATRIALLDKQKLELSEWYEMWKGQPHGVWT